jgi:hypothetical protein
LLEVCPLAGVYLLALARQKIAAQNLTCQTSPKPNSQHSQVTKTTKIKKIKNCQKTNFKQTYVN